MTSLLLAATRPPTHRVRRPNLLGVRLCIPFVGVTAGSKVRPEPTHPPRKLRLLCIVFAAATPRVVTVPARHAAVGVAIIHEDWLAKDKRHFVLVHGAQFGGVVVGCRRACLVGLEPVVVAIQKTSTGAPLRGIKGDSFCQWDEVCSSRPGCVPANNPQATTGKETRQCGGRIPTGARADVRMFLCMSQRNLSLENQPIRFTLFSNCASLK